MIEPAQQSQTGEWSREFDGSLSEISRALAWIESIAGALRLSEDQSYALMLCADELVSNVMMHNGDLSDRLHVRMSVEAKPDRIVLTIEDNGVFFDIVNAPAKQADQPLGEIKPGGLGIGLIKRFASGLRYERIENRNRVVAEFIT
ncbi:MAG: ATP-binding protein [Methylocystis sp.]|uniref:ATP-binding protein n=1 Tax=Methylocystis sp. TaxID=1911079 RepID=UPI003DA393B7